MLPFLLFALLAVAGGVAIALQVGVNARLGRGVGDPVLAAFISIGVSLLTLALVLLVRRPSIPTSETLAAMPQWVWIGGLFGAFYVTMTVLVAPRLGAATLVALVVAGQLATAVVLDHFGWLGFPERVFNTARAVGVLMLIGGTLLVRLA